MTTPPLRLLFFGSPSFAVPSLRALVEAGHDVRAVYTQPDRPAGRGRKPRPSPVAEAARALGLPVEQPARMRGPGVIEQLAGYAPDTVVLAAYGLLIPQAALDVPRLGWLNVHPSLLPRYRGASPVAAPILEGDEETGVSIFLMRRGLDDGPVLAQAVTPIGPTETAGELTDRLATLGALMLPGVLGAWAAGRIRPAEQDHERATYAPKLAPEHSVLDWSLPALVLERRVRAYNPWPVAHARWGGERLRVLSATAEARERRAEPGEVYVGQASPHPLVACGEGALALAEVQPAGARAMPGDAFLRGRPSFAGARLYGDGDSPLNNGG